MRFAGPDPLYIIATFEPLKFGRTWRGGGRARVTGLGGYVRLMLDWEISQVLRETMTMTDYLSYVDGEDECRLPS